MAQNTWELLRELKDGRASLTATRDPVLKLYLDCSYEYAVSELNELDKVRCSACSGFGHTNDRCPTEQKLTNLAKVGGTHAELLAIGRDALYRDQKNDRFSKPSKSTIKFGPPVKGKGQSEVATADQSHSS